MSKGTSFIKYRWQYRDDWRNEHEGSGEIDSGTYSVHCKLLPLTAWCLVSDRIKVRRATTWSCRLRRRTDPWASKFLARLTSRCPLSPLHGRELREGMLSYLPVPNIRR